MMSKAKARAAAAADKARTALDNGENENPQQLAAPPQLAPPAFGGGPEEDALPAGWEAAVSRSTGETYYINSVTGASQYDRPIADEEDPEEEFGEGSRRESLKARAAQAKAKAAKAIAECGREGIEESLHERIRDACPLAMRNCIGHATNLIRCTRGRISTHAAVAKLTSAGVRSVIGAE